MKVVMAVLVFSIIQSLGGMVAIVAENGIEALTNPADINMSTTALALTVAGTGIVSVLVLAAMGMIRLREAFRPHPTSARMTGLALSALVVGVMGLGLLSERLDLPNLMQEQFKELARNGWGVLCVAVLGPVMEELVFREGIAGSLLRKGAHPWAAILVSALCFGIIHFNPVQVLVATCMGVLLGMVYYKSGGNILLCALMHIINNSVSVAEMRVLGDRIDEFTYTDLLGGMVPATIIMAACLALCVWISWRYWRGEATEQ